MIHAYKQLGLNIVLDVCSGSVHVVDEVAYDIIEMYENNDTEKIIEVILEKYKGREDVTREDILDCISDIEELRADGKLFSEDTFEPMAGDLKKKSAGIVKALCLHIAHSCNLNCSYCFASQGKYHGERALMSFEVGKQAFDFLIANSGTRRNLEVDFFGGEPLMNFDVVKEIVEYGREQEKLHNKNFRFTVTTNGVLLDDEKQEYINKNMHNVVLSIDGRKEINDFMRPRAGGQGSYDLIVPNFQKLAECRHQTD